MSIDATLHEKLATAERERDALKSRLEQTQSLACDAMQLIQFQRDDWMRKAEEANKNVTAVSEACWEAIRKLAESEAGNAKLRDAAIDALVPIAVLVITDRAMPYKELSREFMETIVGAHDKLVQTLTATRRSLEVGRNTPYFPTSKPSYLLGMWRGE